MRRVTIYGSGRSLALADFKSLGHRWATGSMFKILGEWPDLYFCMHDHDPIHQLSLLENTGYIDKNKYPLEQITKRYKSRYFTNTISYMIAFAMYKGYKHITLSGVDLEPDSEWAFERPSVAYWVGRAEGLGIVVDWDIKEPCFMYGYEENDMRKALSVLAEKQEIGKKELAASKNEKEKDQWIGYLFAVDQMIKALRS